MISDEDFFFSVIEGSGNVSCIQNVTVLDDSSIGSQTIIWSGTVIRERCRIGNYCIIHPNVIIGADGFGYRPSPDGRSLAKIPQIGMVNHQIHPMQNPGGTYRKSDGFLASRRWYLSELRGCNGQIIIEKNRS